MRSDNFNLMYGYESKWIQEVTSLFNKTEMNRDNSVMVDRATQNSQVLASVWNGQNLLAIGRMLTDFQMYSNIFDVVVDPEFQKKGLGRRVMEALMAKAPATCFYLTSTFGNEPFYLNLGYRYHKTAMARYPEFFGKSSYLDWEREIE